MEAASECLAGVPICNPGWMAELVSNDATEDAAIAWVIQLERATVRSLRDTHHSGAADID